MFLCGKFMFFWSKYSSAVNKCSFSVNNLYQFKSSEDSYFAVKVIGSVTVCLVRECLDDWMPS